MGVGEGPTEVVVEQCSELDQSAAQHLGRWLKCRFLGPPPEMLAYLVWGRPGNLRFNQCLREFPWETLAPEHLGVFPNPEVPGKGNHLCPSPGSVGYPRALGLPFKVGLPE